MECLKLTFGDIMQSNILYFDNQEEEACHRICDTLSIGNMPDYDSIHNYELSNKVFSKRKISDSQKVSIGEGIFDDSVINKFNLNHNNVLFVFDMM
jgi:hypothetical protein